jgi:hypothetical protein
MTRRKYTFKEVFTLGTKNRSLVKKYYLQWRKENRLPYRCDNPVCLFHIEPPLWNGRDLKMILDHKSGNAFDNSTGNLRLLCPNCDSQLETRGGGNINRISNVGNGYVVRNKNGTQDGHSFGELPTITLTSATGKNQ